MTMRAQGSHYLCYVVSLWDGSAGSLFFTNRRLNYNYSGACIQAQACCCSEDVPPDTGLTQKLPLAHRSFTTEPQPMRATCIITADLNTHHESVYECAIYFMFFFHLEPFGPKCQNNDPSSQCWGSCELQLQHRYFNNFSHIPIPFRTVKFVVAY